MQDFNFRGFYFLRSVLASNFKRINFPFKLAYAVTYRCNLKCKMCGIWKKPADNDELDVNQVENFFKKANNFSWIGINGGEPFLKDDLREIIDIILGSCKKLHTMHFATNGQLTDRIIKLTEHILKNYKRINVAYSVSIDGPPYLHDEIRGGKGLWHKAVETFKRLKGFDRVKPRAAFTLSAYNIGEFENTFAALKNVCLSLKSDDFSVNIFQKSSFYYDNRDVQDMDADRLNIEIKKILRMSNRFSINTFLKRIYLKLYLGYIRSNRCPVRCQALSSTCFLDPYGNLYPCIVYDKKLLNIKNMKEGFKKIWNSEYAKKLSYECSNNLCPSCWSPCDAYSAIGGSVGKAISSYLLKNGNQS